MGPLDEHPRSAVLAGHDAASGWAHSHVHGDLGHHDHRCPYIDYGRPYIDYGRPYIDYFCPYVDYFYPYQHYVGPYERDKRNAGNDDGTSFFNYGSRDDHHIDDSACRDFDYRGSNDYF